MTFICTTSAPWSGSRREFSLTRMGMSELHLAAADYRLRGISAWWRARCRGATAWRPWADSAERVAPAGGRGGGLDLFRGLGLGVVLLNHVSCTAVCVCPA